MPLYFIETIKSIGILGVWKIEEDENTLLRLRPIPENEKTQIEELKNEKKRCHRLAYRVLLKEILKKDFTIIYDENGKPYIKENKLFLSVSHSGNYVAVIISPTHKIGIDIERISNRMSALASRFLTSGEMQTIDLQNIESLHVYWGAKECLYKMYSDNKPIFNEQLSIQSFDITKDQQTTAYIKMHNFTATHQVCFRRIEDYMLVYVS